MNLDAIPALGPELVRQIESLLKGFIEESGARSVHLLDRQGRALAAGGDRQAVDTVRFAALAAAGFEAARQLASLLAGQDITRSHLEGATGSIHLAGIGRVAILAAVFDSTSSTGAPGKIQELVTGLAEIVPAAGSAPDAGRGLDPGWTEDASDEIDRLFGA